MVNKRRLSHGSTASSLLGDIVEEDEFPLGDDLAGPGLAGNNRRRSMMGGGSKRRQSSGARGAEQARISEMYKTVIKMSSENVRESDGDSPAWGPRQTGSSSVRLWL